MRRRSRWIIVLGGVAVLVSVPALVASLPVDDPALTTPTLLARVAASAGESFEGLYESRGGLALPDLGRLENQVAPFAQTTRVQVWYSDPENWRADTQSIGGEDNWYREPGGIWGWESDDRQVVFSPRDLVEPLRLPRAMDLSPPELGRRVLDEADPGEITRIGPRRVAGRATAGLRITPQSTTTTIDAIDLWVEAESGIVLRVEVETGGVNPILETQFLDFSTTRPSTSVLRFDADEAGARVRRAATLDVVEQIGQVAALIAPTSEAIDLPRRGSSTAITFGSDFAVVVVAIAPERGLGRAINALAPTERPWGGEAAIVETPLVNVEIATIGGIDHIIAGTVTVDELDRLAGLLAAALAT